ncbi:MAG: hypothetical protein KJ023_21565 [Burkholderiaceae bacterium]|nr:hypothetical protein [Burkholderiaceae bacterium]
MIDAHAPPPAKPPVRAERARRPAASGLPSLAFGSACALYAPAGTPAAQIDLWNRAMRKVLALPDVRQRVQDIGYTPMDGSTPAEVTGHESRMKAHWTPIVKATGFKGE